MGDKKLDGINVLFRKIIVYKNTYLFEDKTLQTTFMLPYLEINNKEVLYIYIYICCQQFQIQHIVYLPSTLCPFIVSI